MGISDDRFSAETSNRDWQVFQAIKVRLYARGEPYARAFSFFIQSFIKKSFIDSFGLRNPGPALCLSNIIIVYDSLVCV